MKENYTKRVMAIAIMATMAGATAMNAQSNAEGQEINRYKTDFYYRHIGYQILSESEHTVAVTQDYDIDSPDAYASSTSDVPSGSEIGENGFLMSYELRGKVVIPQTVYDEEGTAYTVVALADGAIDYVDTQMLILPPTLTDLNGGINVLSQLSYLYLPGSLTKIEGINYCENLNSLYIPWSVETIGDYSLSYCGIMDLFLPPAVKTLGSKVLTGCENLSTAILSKVETMGSDCFNGCTSLSWANLPETLKSMGSGCFNNCANLERISLPWSEINMDNCFNGCPSVSCIEVLATEPYPFPKNSFLDIDRAACDLLVPEESVEKYMAAEGWKDFYRINGIANETGAVKSAENTSAYTAIGQKGYLSISNPAGMTIDITGLKGEKIASVTKTGNSELPLPMGVYIVTSPAGSSKVTVK